MPNTAPVAPSVDFKEVINGNFDNIRVNSIKKPAVFVQKITDKDIEIFKEKFGGK